MNYFKIPNWVTESFTARMICRLLVFSIFIITGSSQLTAQTAIPNNSEFDNAITGCLAEQSVTGLCTTYGTESGYGTMPNWDTSSITQMDSAFRNKNDFNGDISGWNTSSVTHMNRMFEGTGSFSQDIRTTGNSWIVVQVQNFNRMFESSAMVDAPLSAPDLFNNNPTSIQAYKVWFASAPDSTGPSMTITAAEVADGSTSNDTTLALTFEAGEVTTNFAVGDITVDGGTLSVLTANGNGTTYTATFTPTGDGATTIDVEAGTFTDASSNNNTAATQFNWTFDSTGPSMTITAAGVADGATSNNATLALTFEAGKVTTNFAEGDITLAGGNLSNFAANVNGTTYTATFTPTGDGATTIDVGAGKFTDASSNTNTAATQFNWTFDSTGPTVGSVAVPSNGSYKEDGVLNFTVNTTEAVNVVGTPQIAVTVGSTAREAAYMAGASTSTALLFRYTVVAGETDTDGVLVGTLGLNGGTIKDAAENALNLTLNTVGATISVLVDTTAPTLSDVGIASDNESPTVGNIRDNVILFFTASETIGQPTVTFQSGGAAIADTSITYDNTAGTTWTASYAIDTKDSLGDVSYEIIFSDLAGNAGDQNFKRNGSVNLPPVTNPDFECTTCTGIEAPLGELIAYSIYDGGIPVQVVLKDAEGAILTDLSKIQEVTVELISGVGTLTTNPTGTSIILPNDGDAIFDFQVLSSSPGQITMGASVTTTDGVRHNLDTLTVEFSADPEAAIGSVEILTQPALGQRNLLLTGGLFLNQPVVRLLDSNGNLKSSDNSTVVTARIISGNGSLNANGPETQVQVVNGIATFTGLSISALNNNPDQVYTLLFSAIDHIPARSEAMRYVDALTIVLTAPGSTTDGSFIVTAKFSNAVTGLSISHITVPTSEGTVTELSGSEKSYEFTVDPIPGKTVKITIPAGVVQDSAGNMNFASNTLSVQAGAPGVYFDENKDEIRSVIVELEQRLLQNKLTTNQKMMQDARARFIACRRQNDAGEKRNATPCKNQFLDFDGVADLDDGDFMTKGTFLEKRWSKDGVENRMAFGDFDIQSYKNGSTTSSINGRLVWERYKYDNAMFGRYISGTFGVSKLRGIFEGTQRRYGVGAGAYFVAQLDEALFGDAHISGHLVKNSFSMEDGTLSLDGDYLTQKFTVGGALTGVIEYEGFELRPELAYNYGKTFIGNVDLNGQSWGLTDSGLKLDSEIVSVSRITLRPEFYFSAAEFLDLGDNAMFTFSPRYICERLSPNEATQSCGQGFEFGFSNQSDDGLMKISISYQVDHLHNDKTSTLEFSFGLNF